MTIDAYKEIKPLKEYDEFQLGASWPFHCF